MKHRGRLFWMASLAALFGAAFEACLDTTPVIVSDAGADAASPDAFVDPNPACRSCIERECLQACRSTEQCMEIFECSYQSGCAFKPTQQEVLACGIPCATSLGITNVTDPAIAEILKVTACGTTACSLVCSDS